MLKAKLVVVGGDAKSTEVNLKLPTVIGRGKEAGLTVPHALVSRRHTEIFERDGKLFVRDLGSLNGTFVNNTKIEGEQPLEPNQLLTLGNITFRAVYQVSQQLTERDDDTVTFEEMKTVEELRSEVATEAAPPKRVQRQVEQQIDPPVNGKSKPVVAASAGSAAGDLSDLSFEDIDLEESVKSSENKQPAPAPAKPVGSAERVDSAKRVAPAKPPEVKASQSDSQPEKSPAIDLDSAIFNLGSDIEPAEQVSPSALEHLPGKEPMVSFIGEVDLGDEVKKSGSIVESVQIDLGEEQPGEGDIDDERLASFIDKLP